MKLYGALLSPFVMRPILVSRAKGHPVEASDFDGGIKSEAYLALSPIGKMPLLVDGDFVLPESQLIAEYFDAALDGPKLTPADPQVAARVRLVCRIADTYFVPHLGGLFGARDNPEGLAPAKAGIADALRYIEHFRNADDAFAVGDSFGLADAALIPLFFFLDAMDRGLGTAQLIADQPGVAAYWARAKATELGATSLAEQSEGMKRMMANR